MWTDSQNFVVIVYLVNMSRINIDHNHSSHAQWHYITKVVFCRSPTHFSHSALSRLSCLNKQTPVTCAPGLTCSSCQTISPANLSYGEPHISLSVFPGVNLGLILCCQTVSSLFLPVCHTPLIYCLVSDLSLPESCLLVWSPALISAGPRLVPGAFLHVSTGSLTLASSWFPALSLYDSLNIWLLQTSLQRLWNIKPACGLVSGFLPVQVFVIVFLVSMETSSTMFSKSCILRDSDCLQNATKW